MILREAAALAAIRSVIEVVVVVRISELIEHGHTHAREEATQRVRRDSEEIRKRREERSRSI